MEQRPRPWRPIAAVDEFGMHTVAPHEFGMHIGSMRRPLSSVARSRSRRSKKSLEEANA